MKSTKTLLIAALAAGAWLAGSSALLAQDAPATPPPGGPPAGEHAPGMKSGRPDFAKDLDLTDAQKPKFKEIMKGAQEKRKALHDDTALTAEEKKAKGKAIQEEVNAQMKALLTPEQFAKWQEMAKHMRGGRPPGGGPGGPPPGDKPQN
jgi:Spy/CpxP family protein refolding chaperone